jgi:hypothetical protein
MDCLDPDVTAYIPQILSAVTVMPRLDVMSEESARLAIDRIDKELAKIAKTRKSLSAVNTVLQSLGAVPDSRAPTDECGNSDDD